jgi:hypothetical protein
MLNSFVSAGKELLGFGGSGTGGGAAGGAAEGRSEADDGMDRGGGDKEAQTPQQGNGASAEREMGGYAGSKRKEVPRAAGGAAGGAAQGKSEADDGLGGGGIGAGAGDNTQAKTSVVDATGGGALPKSEADGLAGEGTKVGAGGVTEAETLKAELISDAADHGETVSRESPGNFFGRIVKACKAVEKMAGGSIFKDARAEKARGVADPITILEGLLNCWKNAAADKRDSSDTLIRWIREV